MGLQFHYSKRQRSSYTLHSGSMKPIKSDSHFDYTEYKAEIDRRNILGEVKKDYPNNNNIKYF